MIWSTRQLSRHPPPRASFSARQTSNLPNLPRAVHDEGRGTVESSLSWRRGKVFADRYHVQVLDSPRQVRNALCYVLQNSRHHGRQFSRHEPTDPLSSGWYFDGWRHGPAPITPTREEKVVAPARSWLLRKGWRRHGLIGLEEVPAGAG